MWTHRGQHRPPQAIEPGGELTYDIIGAYLFGPPAAALPFETRVRLADERLPTRRRGRVTLLHGALAYRDRRLEGGRQERPCRPAGAGARHRRQGAGPGYAAA